MRSNLTDIDAYVHHETELGLLVSTTGIQNDAVWVPKKDCEFEDRTTTRRTLRRPGTLTLPEPLAIEKGLV